MTVHAKRRILMAVTMIVILAPFVWLLHAPPRPFEVCNTGLDGMFAQYMVQRQTNAYPNVEGDSMKSLALLMSFCDADHAYFVFPPLSRSWHRENRKDLDRRINQIFKEKGYVPSEECAYGYVPGLKYDDPHDLVLMYGKVKTRYRRSGEPEEFGAWFQEPRWIIVCVGFYESDPGCELNLFRDTPEFKRRLEATLAFLKANNRPYWETVVK